jgi:hypothetical protein
LLILRIKYLKNKKDFSNLFIPSLIFDFAIFYFNNLFSLKSFLISFNSRNSIPYLETFINEMGHNYIIKKVCDEKYI